MGIGKTSTEVTAMRRVLAEARSWEPTSKSKGTTPITDVIRFKQNYNLYNNVTGNVFPEPLPPTPVADGIWYPAKIVGSSDGPFSGGTCRSIAYDGTSTWVAVGVGVEQLDDTYINNVWYSTTGIFWTLASGGAFDSGSGIDIAYHQGLWVAVGAGDGGVSNIWYSSNASNWLLNSNQIGDGIPFENGVGNKITYGDGYWVAVGSDSNNQNIWYSSNASNWLTTNITDLDSDKPFYGPRRFGYGGVDVKFNGSKWVAVGRGTGGSNIWITTTANLNNWSNVSPLAFGANRCTSVAFNGSTWVATGVGVEAFSKIWYSTDDAQSWTEASNEPFGLGDGPNKVVYADGKWVAVGSGYDLDLTEHIWYSSNASNWTLATGDPFNTIPGPTPPNTAAFSVAYGNNSWVAVGLGADSNQNIWQSTDGTAWFSASGGAFGDNRAVTVLYGGGKWVAGGVSGLWTMTP